MTRGKSGIHENAGFGRLDIGTVAGGATAEDGKFDGHEKTLTAEKYAGNFFHAVKLFSRSHLTFQISATKVCHKFELALADKKGQARINK